MSSSRNGEPEFDLMFCGMRLGEPNDAMRMNWKNLIMVKDAIAARLSASRAIQWKLTI